MFRKLVISTIAALSLSTGAGLAAGAAGHIVNYEFSFQGPFGRYDQDQLQRGLQVFTEVCSACHGLQYVAYRNLADENGLGYTPEQAALGTGGPGNPDHLYTPDMLADVFSQMQITVNRAYTATLDEGRGHSGPSALHDFVATG